MDIPFCPDSLLKAAPSIGVAMKTAVIVFPGSNCDRDAEVALRDATGQDPAMVWHKDGTIPEGTDLVMVPGGFSYGEIGRAHV